MRVLIVEDEAALREQLARRLGAEGFVVDTAADGEEGLYFATEYPVDLAVIDIGLPGRSGIDVIRGLREKGREYPVLILTARSSWQEKVEGLEAGADDYLVKPFHVEELLARLRALLRRAAGNASAILHCGSIALDPAAQSVAVGERPLDLTAYEYRLLHYLMLHPGKVVSKGELVEHIYPDDEDPDSNVIEVFVARLRRKLDPDSSSQPIETLRGRGYRLRSPMAA